jgi:hypothetical protein
MQICRNLSGQSEQLSLLDTIEAAEFDRYIKRYRQLFARDARGPYAIQHPGQDWKTRHKPVSDPLLKAHLNQQYWVAVKAAWYPFAYCIDFDAPSPGEIERVIEAFNLATGQYLLMTSPSYVRDLSCHLMTRLELRGRIPTHRLGYEALWNMVGRTCEVYPQLRRKFRLPLGRDQRLIAEDGRVLDSMNWWEAMYWIEKLDPVPIENLRFQMELPFPSPVSNEDNPRTWAKSADARELYEHGLQAQETRHASTWILAVSLWRANWLPQDAMRVLKQWIRKKHNGFSKTALKGNWRAIDEEIARQVQWIWTHFRPYPDTPHNLDGYVTLEDLKFIAEVYPCDVVNQKRLFALACYMRPRARHDFVYVPARVWREEIAHKDTYHAFRQDLEAKGLLESIMSYRHVEGVPDMSYSRRFRLHLPNTSDEPLQTDNRNEHDYYQAVLQATGSVRDAVALTGVSKQRFYDAISYQSR